MMFRPLLGFRIAMAWLALSTLAIADSPPNQPVADASIVFVGAVADDMLAVTIDEGRVTLGGLVAYQDEAGDVIDDKNPRRSVVIRGGKPIGLITGSTKSPQRWIRMQDVYHGKRADRERLTKTDSWSASVDGVPLRITDVFRKSRVTDVADRLVGRPEVCFRHTIFLKCDRPIGSGAMLITSADPVIDDFRQPFSRSTSRSEAVHVSTVGFRPDDPVKMGVLSCWAGDGGAIDYQKTVLPGYRIVDVKDGRVVHRGQATLLRPLDQPADHQGLQGKPDGTQSNYAGTSTFRLDFSQVSRPGVYRIAVDGIGTSHDFKIARDVYRPILELSLDGLDAHRWGERRELDLIDGSTMVRPAAVPRRSRSYADVPIFETRAAYTNANFQDFPPGVVGEWSGPDPAATVAGGYMDAGDFDRNHNHWAVGYWLLDLAARQRKMDSDRSERLIEASLWDIEFWTKLQSADGSVPSAVEYSEHPREGEPSWLNTLPMYVCAPSVESNLHFVVSSAKAAAVLEEFGRHGESDRLAIASGKALHWAEQHFAPESADDAAVDAYMLALCELWNATGDAETRRKAMRILQRRVPEAWSSVYPDALLALLTILEMPDERSGLSDRQRERFEGSVKHCIKMNYLDGSTRRSPFAALKNGWVRMDFGKGGWPTVDSLSVLRAWRLFDDSEYLAAAVTGLAYCLGGNPNNMVYMTGVNETSVRNILHCDTRYSGRRAPVGIPIYGPALTGDLGNAWPLRWHLAGDQTIYPEYKQWPAYENVHQFWNWGLQMEYTVHQSHVSAIYLSGMLDAREN